MSDQSQLSDRADQKTCDPNVALSHGVPES